MTSTSLNRLNSSEVSNFRTLSFNPDKVHIDKDNGIVTKITDPVEVVTINEARHHLNKIDNTIAINGMPVEVRVANILGYDESQKKMTLEYADGINIEQLLRNGEYEEAAQVLAVFKDFMIKCGLGWADWAPRNMMYHQSDSGERSLTLVDFEKESRFSDAIPSSWWARSLHGYALEELSCILPSSSMVRDILGDSDSIDYEPSELPLESIKSQRKRALIEKLIGSLALYKKTIPTEVVREVEAAMAHAAQPYFNREDGRMVVVMDEIEQSIARYGIKWYEDFVISKNPSLQTLNCRYSNLTTPELRKNNCKEIISPTHLNIVRQSSEDDKTTFTFEKPNMTLNLPADRDTYLPTKTAADVTAILETHYGRKGLKGKTALELGCGDHAAIAHSLHALGADSVLATDIDEKAIEIVSEYGNPALSYRQSNMFENLNEDEKFDVILFNAPQMPMTDAERENLTDWHDSPGPKGYEIILKTLAEAKSHLKENGVLTLMIFDFLLSDGAIAEQAKKHGFSMERIETPLAKPIRKGGKTAESLKYIEKVFPKLKVEKSNALGDYIPASLIEFRAV